jgi:HlyD family secretion protein
MTRTSREEIGEANDMKRMKYKKIIRNIGIFLTLGLIIGFIVFQREQVKQENINEEQELSIPVEVMMVEKAQYDETLNYIGSITADHIQSLSFKSPGKILGINVQQGDYVEQGDILMQLDTSDLLFEIEAAQKAMEAAYAQYQLSAKGSSSQELEQARLMVDKAQEVYSFQETTLKEYERLYSEGVISNKEYEQAVLEANVALNDLNTAKQAYDSAIEGADDELLQLYYSQYEQAKISYNHKQTLLEDAVLTSTISGTIIELPYEENTMIPAGQPVVHIRRDGANISIGVTSEDYEKIHVEDPVFVKDDSDRMREGIVLRKNNIPDQATHLYDVEVYLEEEDILIGKIVECRIIIGQKEGIMIPIQSAIVNGETYVYIYEGGQAWRRPVDIQSILDDQIIVTGLNDGDSLIISNIKKVNEGKAVSIIGEELVND